MSSPPPPLEREWHIRRLHSTETFAFANGRTDGRANGRRGVSISSDPHNPWFPCLPPHRATCLSPFKPPYMARVCENYLKQQAVWRISKHGKVSSSSVRKACAFLHCCHSTLQCLLIVQMARYFLSFPQTLDQGCIVVTKARVETHLYATVRSAPAALSICTCFVAAVW